MRHYEVVFLVHPDQSDQVSQMLERYQAMIEGHGGAVHRVEDWGRRQLAYSINKIYKAHYALLNIECNDEALEELETAFKFNDAVLRKMILRCDKAESEQTELAKEKVEDDRQKEANERARQTRSSDQPEQAAEEAAEPAAESTDAADDNDAAADADSDTTES